MVKLSIFNGLALLAAARLVAGAAFTRVNNFGNNPSGAKMYIYVPDGLPANAPIMVSIHYCSGTAKAMYDQFKYDQLADQYKYIVIYPETPTSGGCWDVSSRASLTHNGGGDSLAIVNMVKYAINQYKADASRVYAMGCSSGAMMTQVLMGAYPDVFAAGSSWAGVPYGCFALGDTVAGWNSQCSGGKLIKTGQQWGDQVRSAYPGYTGKRPRVQVVHGTKDETLNFQNYLEAVKEWTNVAGVSETPTKTTANSPLSGWTRYDYGPNVEAIKAEGQTHNLYHIEAETLKWFGLDGSNTSPPASSSTPPPSGGGTVAKWGQCGGNGYTGATQCVSGSTCVKVNDWYSQCQ